MSKTMMRQHNAGDATGQFSLTLNKALADTTLFFFIANSTQTGDIFEIDSNTTGEKC